MARLRAIKPGFFLNDQLAECDPLARILFAGLWTIADRAGRLDDRPRRIKAETLPYDDCDVDGLLDQLAARGFIRRYRVGDARYIQVVTWDKHQTPHIREAPSAIPAPDEHRTSTGQAPDGHSASTPLTLTDPDLGSRTLTVPVPRARAREEPADGAPARSNPHWDALVSGIGIAPATSQERGRYGKVVRELRGLGATPDDILARCANYRARWPDMDLTPEALMNHWSRMAEPPPPRAGPAANGREADRFEQARANIRAVTDVWRKQQ